MRYLQRFSPRNAVGAIDDLVTYWRQPTPYRWQILALSVGLTFTMMVLMIPESERAPPERPEVTFISTFSEGRTDAEIVASNLENMERRKAREAELAARAERRKQRARALARASGFDPDELERQYSEEPAAKASPSPGPATGEP